MMVILIICLGIFCTVGLIKMFLLPYFNSIVCPSAFHLSSVTTYLALIFHLLTHLSSIHSFIHSFVHIYTYFCTYMICFVHIWSSGIIHLSSFLPSLLQCTYIYTQICINASNVVFRFVFLTSQVTKGETLT